MAARRQDHLKDRYRQAGRPRPPAPVCAAWGSPTGFPSRAHPASPGPISPAYTSEVPNGRRESQLWDQVPRGGTRLGGAWVGRPRMCDLGAAPGQTRTRGSGLGLEESAQGGPTCAAGSDQLPRGCTTLSAGAAPSPAAPGPAPRPPEASAGEGGTAMARMAGQDPTSLHCAHPGDSGGEDRVPREAASCLYRTLTPLWQAIGASCLFCLKDPPVPRAPGTYSCVEAGPWGQTGSLPSQPYSHLSLQSESGLGWALAGLSPAHSLSVALPFPLPLPPSSLPEGVGARRCARLPAHLIPFTLADLTPWGGGRGRTVFRWQVGRPPPRGQRRV